MPWSSRAMKKGHATSEESDHWYKDMTSNSRALDSLYCSPAILTIKIFLSLYINNRYFY